MSVVTEQFDPYRSRVGEIDDLLVIGASAGTGKTWMITHLAARWLLEENHEPGELLMVTFSRAAAGELKARLRKRFAEIGQELLRLSTLSTDREQLGDVRDPPWVRALHDLAGRVGIAILLARHREIFSRLDEVNARTIHSFAAVLRDSSDSDVRAGGELRRRAVHEVITRRSTGDDPVLNELLEHLDGPGTKELSTPGAERLSDSLVSALVAVESAGGFVADRVTLWHDFDSNIAVTALAEELLREAWSRLTVLRVLEKETTFDELISQLQDEITHDGGALASRLRESFKLVLIDEFQDTDRLQWEIFDVAFRHGDNAVPIIVVGDPKQAIYGFRGGDVSVFQRVAGEARSPHDAQRSFELELAVNYRSSAGLLDGLNDLFTHANSIDWHFSRSDDDGPVIFKTVVPSEAHASDKGLLVVRHAEGVKSVDDTIIRDVRAVVRSLINESGVAASDIAVLSARQFTLTQLRRGFERDGVSTVSAGAVSVYLSEAATQMRTLLWILGDARDPRRVALRRATWFEDLNEAELFTMSSVLSDDGISAWARRSLSGNLLARLLSDLDGERHWTDLEHLFELLAQDCPGVHAPSELLARFDGFVADAESALERNDEAQRRVESDDDSVRLMTIHAAKGLQFPIVLIADVEHGAATRGVASWTSDRGRILDADSLIGSSSKNSPASQARADESRRLIYVALTRAERLAVIWGHDGALQWSALCEQWSPDPRSGARREQLIGALNVSPEVLGRATVRARMVAPQLRAMPVMAENLRRWSYSALNVHASGAARLDASGASAYDAGAWGESPSDDIAVGEDHDLFDGQSGTTLGNAIHRVFETCVGRVASAERAALTSAVADAWREHGLAAPTEQIVETFATVLARPLGAQFDHASLDDFVGTSRVACEMRFTMPLGTLSRSRLAALSELIATRDPTGPFCDFFALAAHSTAQSQQMLEGFLTGSIDLVAQVGNSDNPRFVIVDYKSNRLTESRNFEPESLVAEMIHSGYPLQALLYEIALHRYLRGRINNYDPARHLGGLCYLYVRGAARARSDQSGLATWQIPSDVVVAASNLLAGES